MFDVEHTSQIPFVSAIDLVKGCVELSIFGRSWKMAHHGKKRRVLMDCRIKVLNTLRVERDYIRIGHYVESGLMERRIQLSIRAKL